jgi:Conserved protein/domain typically associated with flavoprotein oxygenases, DIM6/NTAB family
MDLAIKKQALRTFTYGLYVILCEDEEKVNGFTINWLSQVSFEPCLIAASVENSAISLPMIQRSRKFTVNVLREGQRELAGALGKSRLKHPDKMANIHYTYAGEHHPILPEALAWVACEVRHTTPAGDSTLLIAEVVDAGMLTEDEALTMKAAGFKHAG